MLTGAEIFGIIVLILLVISFVILAVNAGRNIAVTWAFAIIFIAAFVLGIFALILIATQE